MPFWKTPPPAIRREQVDNLFSQSPFLFFGLLATQLIVTAYFWDGTDHRLLLLWLGANLALLASRVLMIRRYHHLQPMEAERTIRWGRLFTLSSMVSGMLWGVFPVFLLDIGNLVDVFVLTTIMTGLVAGSLVPLSAFFPTHHLFASFTLVPLIFTTLNTGDPNLTTIGVILIIYLLVMYAYSGVVEANLRHSIALRFENLDLLADVQAQKERAERANSDKSRFLAATSHDLRQPLHALDLYLGALSHLVDERDAGELLSKAQQSSTALSELLSALMDISRLDADEALVDRSAVALGPLLETLHSDYQPQAQRQAVTLKIPPCELTVDTDPTLLGRMLRNLLDNAFTHSGARCIELRVQQRGRQARISVCDDGKGIPTAHRERVFSEFHQLNNPERDRSKGLGLGLAIVHRIAQRLDHPLALESKEGEGCRFHLDLPLVEGLPATPATQIAAPDAQDVSGLFIILVDDEKEVRNAMRTLLLQWGCELLVADSLQSLWEELDTLDYPAPDLLLCDYRLRNHRNGLEVITAVRNRFGKPIPAIVISGDTQAGLEHRAAVHQCLMLHKPVTPSRLRTVIHSQTNPSEREARPPRRHAPRP